jgi:hypothetical protein
MPSRNQSGKPMHVHQNPSRKQVKSWKKYPNAIKTRQRLLRREQTEWETLWIKNAKKFARAKLIRMWVKVDLISA